MPPPRRTRWITLDAFGTFLNEAAQYLLNFKWEMSTKPKLIYRGKTYNKGYGLGMAGYSQ